MKKIYIIGNWKMNKTIQEATDFVVNFDPLVPFFQKKGIQVGICPSFLSLQAVQKRAQHLIVGAQNCHYENNGAFTGEVSIPMLQEIGIQYCLVGHSERRLYNNETTLSCHKKLNKLFSSHLRPIYCVGETLVQYEQGLTKEIVKEQIVNGLQGLNEQDIANLIVAYEPVWSIGTGKNASSQIAQDICAFIRQKIAEIYGVDIATKVAILYGGSVKVDNVKEYMSCLDVNGVLVGGASLSASNFKLLIESIL